MTLTFQFELEVEDARRKWDIFRGYSLLTLPAVFAYIFEAMLTTSSANMTLAHDTKVLATFHLPFRVGIVRILLK